jgi:hypothetical protein
MTASLSSGRWILFLDAVTSVDEFFADTYIPFDCECLVAEYSATMVQVSLTEVYHVNPNRPLQMNRVGNWNPSNGLTWTDFSFYQRRNFHGITLKGASEVS